MPRLSGQGLDCTSSARVLLIAFAISVLASTSFAQQPKVLAPHRPIAPKVANPTALPPAVPGSVVGGPWITDANFKSSIYLKNVVETSPVTVTPVLFLSNGTKYVLPDVTLEPSGTAIVDVNAGLQAQGVAGYATLSGYVELQYNWPWDPICASIRVTDVTHSLIFTFGAQPIAPAQSQNPSGTAQVVEGLWWKQETNVTGFVALANTTSQPITATVQISDNNANVFGTYTVTISRNGMKTLTPQELQSPSAQQGGIRVSYVGPQDALIVNGGLEDQSVGYSAAMHFAPTTDTPILPTGAVATTPISIVQLGLMVGAADPMMAFPSGTTFTPYSVLRNISTKPIPVSPTLWWMQAGAAASAQLPQFTLQPYETLSLNLPVLMASAGLSNFSGNVNLEFNTNGQSGLLLAAGSVDQTNTYVFEVASRGIVESTGKSVGYWSTANGDDTMVTIWNPADEAQDFVFRLVFSGGRYNLPVHLEARTTQTLNVSEIINSQLPDAQGNVIPASVQQGSMKIIGNQADNQTGLVAEDSGIYNVKKATCSGNNCITCDGYSVANIAASPYAVGVGGTNQLKWTLTWNTGQQYDYTSVSGTSWSSNAPTAATVKTGLVTGVSLGSALVSTGNSSPPVYTPDFCSSGNLSCPLGQGAGDSSSGNVNFAVYGISPDSGTPGATQVNVTITGSGLPIPCGNCVTVTGGITVAGATTSSDGTQISAVFGLTNASQGVQTVTVTGPTVDGNTPSGSVNFGVAPAVCPSTISVSNVTQLDMKNEFFPLGFLTGMGGVATMVVGPSSTSWDGVAISESVSPVSTTCPAQVPSAAALCTGSGSFDVDGTYFYFVPPLPAPFGPTHNTFYDIHWGPDGKFSALGPNDPNSCTVVCTQQYSCNGSRLGSTFTITRTLTKSTAGSGNTPITLVTVTKQ